jgi:hypothetical protein
MSASVTSARGGNRGEYTAPLGEVLQPNYPFNIVALDICWPYSHTQRGNRFILNFVDYLTRYAEAIPV